MTDLGFIISQWAAWAPGLESPDDWKQWAAGKRSFGAVGTSPSVGFVPAIQRRRLSLLSKITLNTIQRCSQSSGTETQLPDKIIFCSRYGEIYRTADLTGQIVNGDELSPTGFSLSVHNTAVGLNSILTHNQSVFTSIAGGAESFFHGLVEAAALLKNKTYSKVMVVMADESMPEVYERYADEIQIPYGVAFMLRRGQSDVECNMGEVPDSNCQQAEINGNISDSKSGNDTLPETVIWRCRMSFTANSNYNAPEVPAEPQGLSLLKGLLNSSLSWSWDGPVLSWSFTVSHG